MDPDAARERRRERTGQAHTRTIPQLRFIGFSLIGLLGVGLHNRFLLDSFSLTTWLTYLFGVELYCVLTWLVLRRWYERYNWLGDLLLVLDLVPLLAAVWVTGGTASWLFWLPLIRVVDQATTGVRRTVRFNAAVVAGYGGLALLHSTVMPVNWGAEFAKLIFLSGCGLYICLTAVWTDSVHRRSANAIRFARDLIDRLNTQSTELRHATQRAEAANQAKTEFLGRISHELRRPATTVIGFAQLLEMSPLNERQADYLARVSRAGRDLASLVDEVLDLIEIPSASLQLRLDTVPFDDTLVEVLSDLWPAAAERGVRLVSIDEDPSGLVVLAERRALRRVLWNLLSHIIRFSLADDRISVWVEQAGDRLRFSAQDSGPGVLPREFDALLDPTLDSGVEIHTLQDDGLGLAFARSLTLAMNGQLGVHSVPGQSSTYWIELPLAELPAHPVDSDRHAGQQAEQGSTLVRP